MDFSEKILPSHTALLVIDLQCDYFCKGGIIDLMKHVNVSGVYLGPDRVNGVLDFNQKELAAYLARAKRRIRPRRD